MYFIKRPVHPHSDVQVVQLSVLPDLIDHSRHPCPTQLSSPLGHDPTHLYHNGNQYHHCNTEQTDGLSSGKIGRLMKTVGRELRAQQKVAKENVQGGVSTCCSALPTPLWHREKVSQPRSFAFEKKKSSHVFKCLRI